MIFSSCETYRARFSACVARAQRERHYADIPLTYRVCRGRRVDHCAVRVVTTGLVSTGLQNPRDRGGDATKCNPVFWFRPPSPTVSMLIFGVSASIHFSIGVRFALSRSQPRRSIPPPCPVPVRSLLHRPEVWADDGPDMPLT